jgi:4-carboxymuconolactone decarboxylase
MHQNHPRRVARVTRDQASLDVSQAGNPGREIAAGHRKEANMTAPTPIADVDQATRDTLVGLSQGDLDIIGSALDLRAEWRQRTGLGPQCFSLVKIAALVAVDAPPASYLWHVSNALAEGATPRDILGVLMAIAPQVGGPRVIAAAPEIMLALGLSLPDDV